MFRVSLTVCSAAEAAKARSDLPRTFRNSGLAEPHASALREQVEAALGQFEAQMSMPHTQRFSADRRFEGDGYSVSLRAKQGTGLLGAISKLLRRGP